MNEVNWTLNELVNIPAYFRFNPKVISDYMYNKLARDTLSRSIGARNEKYRIKILVERVE